MKPIPFLARRLVRCAATGLIALALAASHSALAQDTPPAGPLTNAASGLTTTHGSPQATNAFGLPPEAFNRLTPDQILKLVQERQNAITSEKESLSDTVVPLLISLGLFTMICFCVGLVLSQRLKRNRMTHETLRLMIEKGQPIPPDLLHSEDSRRRPINDLRNGLILVGVGIGLAVMRIADHSADWAVALIPLLIGVAYLITWKLESKKNGPSR